MNARRKIKGTVFEENFTIFNFGGKYFCSEIDILLQGVVLPLWGSKLKSEGRKLLRGSLGGGP
jgi:hypothetical protein